MTDFSKFAVIKTGWCDSYTGAEPIGNFSYFDEGAGAERFNMQPASDGGYQVYCITPAPDPADRLDWTIAHVAIDPAEQKMKLVGWYEHADFLGHMERRTDQLGGDGSVFCIRATEAYEIAAGDRPTIEHGRQLGSTRLGWLRGEKTSTDWSRLTEQLERLVGSFGRRELAQSSFEPGKRGEKIGDTTKQASDVEGIVVDDGGRVYGFSPSGESADHADLRRWAMKSVKPFTKFLEAIEATDDAYLSATEHPLLSGDRIDAVHIGRDHAFLVEAKSWRSGEKDIERGIYQCLKYREVFIAMHQYSRKRVRSILLTQNTVSTRLQALAERLDVDILTKPLKAR